MALRTYSALLDELSLSPEKRRKGTVVMDVTPRDLPDPDFLQPRYHLAPNPPPAMSWDEYSEAAVGEFGRLLGRDPREDDVQEFLERNPSFIPGALTPPPGKSGSAPFPWAVIAQPELRGIGSRRPDFLWIAMHSGVWYPTLVEIERPAKKVYRRGSQTPTAEFTQALNQLKEWRTWFAEPTNQQLFIEQYHVPDYMTRFCQMMPHFVLIYGRRAEFEDHPQRSKHRISLIDHSQEELMSYDRLAPERDLWCAMTVRLKPSGRYEAVAVPPTLQLGPWIAEDLLLIDDIPQAIDSCSSMTNERKEFLKTRLLYWQTYAADRAAGPTVITSECWE